MDDMLVSPNIEFDIQVIDGQKQLIIDGAIIGPRKEVIQHLRKSEGYDIFMEGIHDEEKQEAISHGGVSQ